MKKIKMFFLASLLLLLSGALFAAGGQESSTEAADSGAQEIEKVKAGFVYIGPAGDFGWTYAHDQGRLYVEKLFPWLETITVESVPEGDAVRFIDRMVAAAEM